MGAAAVATRPAPFQPAPRLAGGVAGPTSPGALRISQGEVLAVTVASYEAAALFLYASLGKLATWTCEAAPWHVVD